MTYEINCAVTKAVRIQVRGISYPPDHSSLEHSSIETLLFKPVSTRGQSSLITHHFYWRRSPFSDFVGSDHKDHASKCEVVLREEMCEKTDWDGTRNEMGSTNSFALNATSVYGGRETQSVD